MLIDGFNNCGYWNLRVLPDMTYAAEMCSDASSYSLEANTTEKYNYVIAIGCLPNRNLAFDKACQALVNLAGLDKEFWVYRDKLSDTDTTQLVVPDISLEQPIEHKSKRKNK